MNHPKDNLPQSGNEGAGRTHNSTTAAEQTTQKVSSDISAIDQQEGSMNRGETGDAGNSDATDIGEAQ